MVPMLLACALAQKPEGIEQNWKDTVGTGLFAPTRRQNHAFPLSDQENKAEWKRYEPLWDEFNGDKLDAGKWHDHNPDWKGRQPAWFNPANVKVSGGKLQLLMTQGDAPEELKKDGYKDFQSAAVKSKERVLYGYFEIGARAMSSAGSSAFWFYYGDEERWTEIDVFEIGAKAKGWERKVNMNAHVFHEPGKKEHWNVGSYFEAPFALDLSHRVYGLEWDKDKIAFYVEGRKVREGKNTHWHQPLTLNFDSETMPDWFGLPDPKDLPSTFSIDYVRVWKRSGMEVE